MNYDPKGTVNFDNSASSFPKPDRVRFAVAEGIKKYGGNPGRGGHALSMAAAEQVYKVRRQAAELFSAQVENVAFTPNCTYALNMAIKGIMQYGGHIIISGYEHNACARPVYALTKRGVKCSVAEIFDDDGQTVAGMEKLIRQDTLCICCMIASNVTGRILPYKQIAQLCRRHKIAFIADGAQACGVLDISLDDGMSFLCTSGQKGLYGPSGTGMLITSGEYPLSTIIEGGTGATSAELEQTPYMPEKLESGSINTPGIMGLGAGMTYIKSMGTKRIREHEAAMCQALEQGLDKLGAVIYDKGRERVPIVAFNLKGKSSEETAAKLNSRGFSLRGGLHCAALAHETLGTLRTGAVRFSPSAFNNMSQVGALLNALGEIDRQ